MRQINMIISNEYYMYLLCIYILNVVRFIIYFLIQHKFDVLDYEYVFNVIQQYRIYFYSKIVGYESVVELIYHNYSLFKCSVEKFYLTAVNTVSNKATCSSPTYGAKIISNNSLLSTSAFSLFESNIHYPKTLIS